MADCIVDCFQGQVRLLLGVKWCEILKKLPALYIEDSIAIVEPVSNGRPRGPQKVAVLER